MKKKLTKKQINEKLKEGIKKLLDDPPEGAKELTLSNGKIIKSLIVCVYCLAYISQSWAFCPNCGKKSKKLSQIQRREAIYKMLKEKLNHNLYT